MISTRKNIFVTGSTGFIGSNLVKKLIVSGYQVFGLSRTHQKNEQRGIRTIRGNLLNPESYLSFLKQCDIIYHCAAFISFHEKDYNAAYQINVQGTERLCESAYRCGINKMIHLSACSVLGYSSDSESILDETANPAIKKNNVYGYTKKCAEEVINRYVQKGLNISIANIATVYGAGDIHLNSGTIIKSIYEGKMKYIPPGGTSFVAVNDLIDGLILLCKDGLPGERYIFSSENFEYHTLVQRIAKTLDVKPPSFILPRATFLPALFLIKGIERLTSSFKKPGNLMTEQILKEVYHFKYYNAEKARHDLGWKPTVTLEKAVNNAFKFYLKNQLIIKK